MNKKGLILTFITVGILLIIGFFWFVSQHNSQKININETKCVPASCCHSTKCVLKNLAPKCNNLACTMNCEPNTLDCGQGSCKYINGKCEAVLNE